MGFVKCELCDSGEDTQEEKSSRRLDKSPEFRGDFWAGDTNLEVDDI